VRIFPFFCASRWRRCWKRILAGATNRCVKSSVDLRRLLRQNATHAAPALRRPMRGFKWVWPALLFGMVAAAYIGRQAWRVPRSEEPLRAVALTTFPGVESYPSFSPDGDRVAFMWTGPKQDNEDIYVQQVGAGSPLRLTTDPHNDFSPVWSPDGRWIAFLRDKISSADLRTGNAGEVELRLIPPLGGPERKLAEIHIGSSYNPMVNLAWCPGSDYLVFTQSTATEPNALFAISIETLEKTRLTTPPYFVGDGDPAVSPDGQSLAFRREIATGESEIYWLPLGKRAEAAGEPRALTSLGLDAKYPAWMPDGKEILFSAAGHLWKLAVSPQNPVESRPARLPFVGEDGLMPALSRAQPGRPTRLVYVRSLIDLNIWRVETSASGVPASSPATVSISSTRTDFTPAFSPDGRHIAFTSDRSGNMEIWVSDLDGTNAVQLTSIGAVSAVPTWSPDGELIAFHSNVEKQYEVYVTPLSGGKPRRLTSPPLNAAFPNFSRDGQWIYFQSNRTGRIEIWKIPASDGDAVQVTDDGAAHAFASPDGNYLYYTQGPLTAPSLTAPSLWRVPVSGGESVPVLKDMFSGSFAVTNKGIYYVEPGAEARMQFLDLITRRSTTVARNLGNTWPTFLAASPDGRTILYSRVDSSIDDLMLVEHFH
jgi:Tol biopolymer transport system component